MICLSNVSYQLILMILFDLNQYHFCWYVLAWRIWLIVSSVSYVKRVDKGVFSQL